MIAAAAVLAATVQTAGRAASAAEAMASAVPMGCILHVSGVAPIQPARRKEVAAVGLDLVEVPPAAVVDDVRRGTPASWGKPAFSRVTWLAGSAWVIGFAKGQCVIDATSDDGAGLVKALHDQFETPGVPWKKLPPGAAPERYGLALQPPGRPAMAIVANLVGMDLPSTGRREIVTFESTPNK